MFPELKKVASTRNYCLTVSWLIYVNRVRSLRSRFSSTLAALVFACCAPVHAWGDREHCDGARTGVRKASGDRVHTAAEGSGSLGAPCNPCQAIGFPAPPLGRPWELVGRSKEERLCHRHKKSSEERSECGDYQIVQPMQVCRALTDCSSATGWRFRACRLLPEISKCWGFSDLLIASGSWPNPAMGIS